MRRLELLALLLILAGCASTSNSTMAATTTRTQRPRVTTTTASATTGTRKEPFRAIGKSWDDGVKMTLLSLVRDAPRSRSATGGTASDQTVVIEATVANGSSHPLDLRVSLELAYGPAGHKAKAVTDAGKGYRGISPSRLGPAGRAEGRFAFAVPRGHATHLVFTGRPAIGYQPQTWSFPDP